MLTREENELLCRVGPETPMGQMLRRYWMPAMLSSELPERDGEPKRVRLLGEDLVAFRDTNGRVGVLDEYCPHRGASLGLARNEDCALTCIYHGWKIDVSGNVLDTPAEPEESDFRNRIKATAYATREQAGLIWVYMGPPGTEPQFPAFAWTAMPDTHVSIIKVENQCNWLQALEGVLDSAHVSFLHSTEIAPVQGADSSANARNTYTSGGDVIMHAPTLDRRPRFEVEDTPYGYWYSATRRPVVDPDRNKYVRTTHYVTPFWGLFPPPAGTGNMQAFVPVDNEHTYFVYIQYSLEGPLDKRKLQEIAGTVPGIGIDENFRLLHGKRENWGQNRSVMKGGRSWTGLSGINIQDFVVQESMGTMYDRRKEHLGVSDVAVIRMRRVLLDSLERFQQGQPPIGLQQSIPYDRLSGADAIIPIEAPWQSVGAAEVRV
jgi:phthalate 4,5-dioxygenase oxygenase subunit